MNSELIDLSERLERMSRLDLALGEEAKAALLRLIGAGLTANPILDLSACNSLAGALFGTVDVRAEYRIGPNGGQFTVTLGLDGGVATSISDVSLCTAFLGAMCRAAAEL
jgi:hypothetical protein